MDDYRDEPAHDHNGDGDPAAAFERLRGEVALLRAAIGGLSAARESIDIPDYEPTLERTEKVLGALVSQVAEIGKSPAIRLTPEDWRARLTEAVASSTHELRHQVEASRIALASTTREIQAMLASARRDEEQNWWLLWTGLGGLVLGLLLYAALAGPFARAMPASWQWPEYLATRALGENDAWIAGEHLLETSSPQSWSGIVAAEHRDEANRDVLRACEKAAVRAKKPVRCTIVVKAGE